MLRVGRSEVASPERLLRVPPAGKRADPDRRVRYLRSRSTGPPNARGVRRSHRLTGGPAGVSRSSCGCRMSAGRKSDRGRGGAPRLDPLKIRIVAIRRDEMPAERKRRSSGALHDRIVEPPDCRAAGRASLSSRSTPRPGLARPALGKRSKNGRASGESRMYAAPNPRIVCIVLI